MKYFLDTEFLEGPQTKRFAGIPYGKTKPTIDLISIALVAEDEREYYAISKDFNLREAWDRWQPKGFIKADGSLSKKVIKEYWIRENVLKHLFDNHIAEKFQPKTFNEFKKLINEFGKTNAEIAREIKQFIYTCEGVEFIRNDIAGHIEHYSYAPLDTNPEFYAYYADYDWVVFCWLFGLMIELPKGFPKYCRDLKQVLDSKAVNGLIPYTNDGKEFTWTLANIENFPNYPKQVDEHNALADARWGFELFKFLEKL